MLIISAKVNEYVKNGSVMFVYTIDSNATKPADKKAELKDFEDSMGEYFQVNKEDGKPLYWSKDISSVGTELQKSYSGRYNVPRNLEEKAVDLESKTNSKLAGFQALMQFTGKTKAQMQQLLLEGMTA